MLDSSSALKRAHEFFKSIAKERENKFGSYEGFLVNSIHERKDTIKKYRFGREYDRTDLKLEIISRSSDRKNL